MYDSYYDTQRQTLLRTTPAARKKEERKKSRYFSCTKSFDAVTSVPPSLLPATKKNVKHAMLPPLPTTYVRKHVCQCSPLLAAVKMVARKPPSTALFYLSPPPPSLHPSLTHTHSTITHSHGGASSFFTRPATTVTPAHPTLISSNFK